MSSDNPEDLNYDCNYNMFLAKTLIKNLKTIPEQQKAVRWMRKLSTCNENMTEMKFRNDFMYYLVLQIQAGELKSPFTEDPQSGPLATIAHFLPALEKSTELDGGGKWADKDLSKQRPFLYQNSPDGGAFLAAQPIPRCGAFCYLAVVSRAKNPQPTEE